MKERGPRPEKQPERTPRDVAKDMIRPYVLRGDDLDYTAGTMFGVCRREYEAQIGGYAWSLDYKTGIKLKPQELAVTRLGDKPCMARFALADLWHEVLAEAKGEETQGRLF